VNWFLDKEDGENMSIIKTHDITLYGESSSNIILRPLCDEHLPYLYKWCADPEVLYWTEGGTDDVNLSYDKETVHQIYGGASQNALCFLVEVDGVAVGECWLQKMNLPYVIAMYPLNLLKNVFLIIVAEIKTREKL